VISPGSVPEGVYTEGDGTVTIDWELQVVFIVSAATDRDTKRVLRAYLAATKTLLLQKKSLKEGNGGEPFTSGLRYVGDRHDLTPEDLPDIAAGSVIVVVSVPDSLNQHAGPMVPDVPPGTDLPTITSVEVTVQKKEEV
jgi:hypothetical protein